MSSCLFLKYIVFILFSLLITINTCNSNLANENDKFVQVLSKASGVYMNKELATNASLLNPNLLLTIDKTVIVTSKLYKY
jgi:hypothetical protein